MSDRQANNKQLESTNIETHGPLYYFFFLSLVRFFLSRSEFRPGDCGERAGGMERVEERARRRLSISRGALRV